ncbi:MAG: VOC family protein, partial [Verrucomicrobiales bacterium]
PEARATTAGGSAHIVFYSNGLEGSQARGEEAGGAVIRPAFTFPGGRRFHFSDPSGNEYAVWSELTP